MVGQGSPRSAPGANRAKASCCASAWIIRGAVAIAAMMLVLFPSTTRAQNSRRPTTIPLELRIRVKWGQNSPCAWRGTIDVSNGEIVEMRHVGASADGAASYRLREGRVDVHELSPRTESELELLVQSTRDAKLMVNLDDGSDSGAIREAAIPLATLIAQPLKTNATEDGPWLAVARSPSDILRIKFENGRRIFSVGESAIVEIEPHEVLPEGVDVAMPLQLRADLRLVRAETQEEVWYERREIESDAQGRLPPISGVEVPLPRQEGAYEFVIRLESRKFLGGGFNPVEHRQSLIVLGDVASSPSNSPWRTVMEVDPTIRSWWDTFRVLPQIKVPGLSSPATPLASAKTGVISRDGRKWATLAVSSWQAIPLSTQVLGEPHVVQVEVSREGAATPQILLLEQRADGQVVSTGLDASGIAPAPPKPEKAASPRPETRVHSLVYWPTSPTAWLVVASGADAEAHFGAVRLYAGPSELPAASIPPRPDRGRMLSLELSNDRWRQLFGGDARGATSSAEVSYQIAMRLASYLRAKGYNACRLAVAANGKSLYPSSHFDGPTDNGTEIDSAELLLRILSRERLSFTAEFAFNAPLAELEVFRGDPDEVIPGTDLITEAGSAVRQLGLGPGGVGPIYNPLDSQVQAAIRVPLEDFLDRYGHHESFGGIAMRLTSDCYSRLPNEKWGKDSPTLMEFAKSQEGSEAKARPNRQATFIQPDKRDAWLMWRAKELANFYQSIQDLVMQARPESRLYLPLGGLLEGDAAQQHIRNAVFSRSKMREPFSDLWLSAGIAPDSWKQLQDTVFLRPTHVAIDSAPLSKLYNAAENSNEWRRFEESFELCGVAAQTLETEVMLTDFSQRGPFRGRTSNSFMTQPLAPASASSASIEGIIASDPFTFSVDTQLKLDSADPASAEWVDLFRRLPVVMMTPVPPRGANGDSKSIPNTPIVIRQANNSSRTWFYAVNPCPFPVTITVDFQAPAGAKLESLSTKKLPPLQAIGQAISWSYTLAPQEIVGGAINSSKSKLLAYSAVVDRGVVIQLNQELGSLRSKLMQAKQASRRKYDALANPEFDGDMIDSSDFGWQVVSGDPQSVMMTIDKTNLPDNCLRITNQGGIVSLRSEPIAIPKSQRLLFSLHLRTDPGQRPPEVKLVIEGEQNGARVRRATVVKPRVINEQWREIPHKLDYLPNVENLRVGIEVCSPGTVYVDHAFLSDFFCEEDAQQSVLNELAVAVHSLEQGRITQAQKVLNSYLPNYLSTHLDAPTQRGIEQMARQPKETKPSTQDRSIQDRVKEIIPLPKSMIQRR